MTKNNIKKQKYVNNSKEQKYVKQISGKQAKYQKESIKEFQNNIAEKQRQEENNDLRLRYYDRVNEMKVQEREMRKRNNMLEKEMLDHYVKQTNFKTTYNRLGKGIAERPLAAVGLLLLGSKESKNQILGSAILALSFVLHFILLKELAQLKTTELKF